MNKRIINRVKEEGKCMIDTSKTLQPLVEIRIGNPIHCVIFNL